MRFPLTALLAAVAAYAVLAPAGAQAETYKWCAYYGNFGNAATNCGFSTRQQCLATVSGIGGYCDINPRWRGKRSRGR